MATSVADDTSNFDAGMNSAGQEVDTFGQKASAGSSTFNAASVAMTLGAVGLDAASVRSVSAAGNVESAMNSIQAVTGATADQMRRLSQVAIQVGIDTQFSAQEWATAIAELGKAT